MFGCLKFDKTDFYFKDTVGYNKMKKVTHP